MSLPVAVAAAGVLAVSVAAEANPVLRRAEALVAFVSGTTCTVGMTLDIVEGATDALPGVAIEHRIGAASGARVDVTSIDGAARVGDVRTIGATRGLSIQASARPYHLEYSVDQPRDRAFRCPLWLPSVSTDGRSPAVTLTVRLPPGARAGGTMPAFTWEGEVGSAAVGHLPAFVHVPFSLPGAPTPWNTARVMDGVAIATLLAATVWWATRRGQARLRRI